MIDATAPELWRNVILPEKEDEKIFAYVLELMSTLAKMQKISCFMLKVIHALHTVRIVL